MNKSNCLTCQKEFSHYGTKRKFCSKACVPANTGNAARWKDKKPVEFDCVICGTHFAVRPSRAAKYNVKYCCYECHQVGEGRKGGAVAGKLATRRGTGKSYPKIGGRHAHRVVAEQKLGRPLLPGEVVHHDDENKLNYSPENLIVLPNQAAHAKLHVYEMLRKREENKRRKAS